MKKLHRYVLLFSALLLLGGFYYWIYFIDAYNYEVNINYHVNITEGILDYDEIWGIIQSNSSIPDYEIWWINGWVLERENTTQWGILVNMKPKTSECEAECYTFRLDAYTGEIISKSKGLFNYSPNPFSPIRYAVLLNLAGITVILMTVYEVFYRK